MTASNEDLGPGFGNEPNESPFANGHVIEGSYDEPTYDSQDAHFAAVDKLSDQGVATYADGSNRLGYDPSDYERDDLFSTAQANHTPTPGVSVGLQERADAVADLMDGISVRNRLSGAQRSGALAKYANPDRVLEGMERDANYHKHSQVRSIEALAKTAALRAIGFNEAEVESSRVGIQRLVSQAGGTGKEAVRMRNKQKTVTARTAKKVLGSR